MGIEAGNAAALLTSWRRYTLRDKYRQTSCVAVFIYLLTKQMIFVRFWP
jgi:hypothetical protein